MLAWSTISLLHAGVFGSSAVAARLLLVRRRTGRNPITVSRAGSARELNARCFYFWLPFADLAYLLAWAWRGDPGPALLEASLAAMLLRWAGLGLLVVSWLWVVRAQQAMGEHWRMGVDDAAGAGKLCTAGPFARSRHPVYLGIRATLLAQLMVSQSWPMLALWGIGELLAQLQSRFEEDAMDAAFGAAYGAYRARVPRWL